MSCSSVFSFAPCPMSLRANWTGDKISDFCQRWQVIELSLFGSAVRSDFKTDSDIDVLVMFSPDAAWSLLDHIEMEAELKTILGREVDLVSRRAIERSSNHIRRQQILESARTVYVSR